MATHKEAFVSEYLSPMLAAADRSGIESAKYVNDGYDEKVIIEFTSGRTTEVNVNCDSDTAIIWDVVKHLRDTEWN